MRSVEGIPEEIRVGMTRLLAGWRAERGVGPETAPGLDKGIGRVLVVFTEFPRSPTTSEGFGGGGTTRALVREISRGQRDEAGRDAVVRDYAALRRGVWAFVEENVDLGAFDGGEVSRLFVKLMQASDWITEAGLEAYEEIARRDAESALEGAAATDLLTGLPDRDLFDRRLLPEALSGLERRRRRAASVVFDVVNFPETVASEGVEWAREALLRLAGSVGEATADGAVYARFGDDEVCVLLPSVDAEAAYETAEGVLDHLGGEAVPEEERLRVHAGVAGYPEHATDAAGLVAAAVGALTTARRVAGSGIVVAHR